MHQSTSPVLSLCPLFKTAPLLRHSTRNLSHPRLLSLFHPPLNSRPCLLNICDQSPFLHFDLVCLNSCIGHFSSDNCQLPPTWPSYFPFLPLTSHHPLLRQNKLSKNSHLVVLLLSLNIVIGHLIISTWFRRPTMIWSQPTISGRLPCWGLLCFICTQCLFPKYATLF